MDYEKKTIEEKAEAYDEAIEGIQEILSSGEDSIKMSRLRLRLQGIFPGLKKLEDERIKGAIIDYLKDNNLTEWAVWLEKQGGQKPTDKVEPKFKVGDWATDGVCKCQIHFIDDTQYWYSENCILGDIESIDKKYHLWTIQDAKDGDMLTDGSCIFIIKKLNHDHSAEIYCCLHDDGDFDVISALVFDDTSTYPATKEQRDLLFAKMKESGYEWDAEKKELKKIEQKPVSITDEWIEDYWQHKKVNNPYSYDKGEEIQFDYQGFVRFCKKYCKKPSEWSEEDETKLTTAETFIKNTSLIGNDEIKEATIDWLKSLKDRVELKGKWMPNDEQPEHGYLKTVYQCGKKPRWAIGDTLAYYGVYSDEEGECVLGKVTKVELDNQEENDWIYTFEDGSADCEQALLECVTYKKN